MKVLFWILFALAIVVLGLYTGAVAGFWSIAPWMGKSLVAVAAGGVLFVGYGLYRMRTAPTR